MKMIQHVADKMYEKMDEKGTPLMIGLDPNLKYFPAPLLKEVAEEYDLKNNPERGLEAGAAAILKFNNAVIRRNAEHVGVFKLQSAYYEQYGHWGIKALERSIKMVRDAGCVAVLDAKRNDIDATSEAYARAHLGKVLLPDGSYASSDNKADMMTVNAYLGTDGVKPFTDAANEEGKGIFVLGKTSNKSSGELQDLLLKEGEEVFMKMAELIKLWGGSNIGEQGYSNVGVVVGATYPEQMAKIREGLPFTVFLLPGYGAQGGKAEMLVNGFAADGRGAVVNSSRGITYPCRKEAFTKKYPQLADPSKFVDATEQATLDSILEINQVLDEKGKLPAGWKVA